jgi:hypothetical protein
VTDSSAAPGHCTATTNVTVIVNSTLTAGAAQSATICAGGSMPLAGVASGGTGPYTYSWSPATFLDNANLANPTAKPPPGTTNIYTLTVTDSSAAPGHCTATTNVTVIVNSTLTANAVQSTTLCAGESLQLNGSATGGTGPYTFSWTPTNFVDNVSIASPTVTPPAGTTNVYTLTVTDASAASGHCTATTNVTVIVNRALNASIGETPGVLCAGDSVQLTGSATGGTGAYTYSWSPTNYLDNATIASPMATPPGGTTNTYRLTVTDSSAAATPCTATADVTVRVLPELVITTTDSTVMCVGSPLELDAAVTGGTGPYTFSWSPTNYLSNPNVANPTANPPLGTTNVYTLTVTDASAVEGHCEAQATVIFVVKECLPPILISLVNTNALLQWSGSSELLQSTTILTNPVPWSTILTNTNSGPASFIWTNAVTGNRFFRLKKL